MKRLEEIRAIITKHRDILAEKYGVVVGIFGSCVRGKARRGSDIDLLADILRPISLLEIVDTVSDLRARIAEERRAAEQWQAQATREVEEMILGIRPVG